MNILITRPEHDFTTRYLSFWADEVTKLALEKDYAVVELSRDKVCRSEFEGRVNKLKPRCIFLNGHGSDDCVSGHDNQELVRIGVNEHILEDKITYALSCNSAKVLGKKVVEKGYSTYIGYLDEFIFVADRNYLSNPSNDPKAKPFKDSSNQVMFSLLKGGTTGEASTKSKNKFREYCTSFLSSVTDPDLLQAAQLLWWNMKNQACLGDTTAKLA